MTAMRSWLAAVAAVVFAGILAYTQISRLTSGAAHHPAEFPHFVLTDQGGRTVTEADFRGRLLLVYFGYTFCPDVCPTSLTAVAAALDRLGPRADGVQPVMISVDPERDPPELLGEYVASFRPGMAGLTGPIDQLVAAANQFGAVFSRNGGGDSYTMDHSADLYLMGADGRLLQTIPHGTTAAELSDRLARYLP